MPKNRMLVKKEVTTYAEVLLEATKAQGNPIEVAAQFEEVYKTIIEHPGLREAMNDTTLADEVRNNIMTEVFQGYDPALFKVLAVMAERRDFGLLHRVAEEFNNLVEEDLNVVIIDVTTVVELDDALRETIKKKFAGQFGKEIVLREHIDPSILGGIILSAHGRRIDASVQSQLDRVRESLSSVTTGGER